MKIDLHVHSSEMSLCAVQNNEQTVRAYAEAGYDAIVLTNHFDPGTCHVMKQNGLADYYAAHKACGEAAAALGRQYGLLVLYGCELRVRQNINDYLVYGAPDSLFSDLDALFAMDNAALKARADADGFLLYQAHPFRVHMTIVQPQLLHGIEIKNGAPVHDSNNAIAREWAEKYGLKSIAGSDCHSREGVGITGIETEAAVTDMSSLVQVLRDENYRIL